MKTTININGNDVEIELTSEQLAQANKPKFNYPIYKKNTIAKSIVKFTGLNTGIHILSPNGLPSTGEEENDWVKHTDYIWEDIAYDEDRELYDKQPVWVWDDWDNRDTSGGVIRFYDAINKCTFWMHGGQRKGNRYDTYEPVSNKTILTTPWIMKAQAKLED
jgi:hypothetical protein